MKSAKTTKIVGKKLPQNLPRIIVICGPTATGKSDFAVALARKIDGEIISADSRQVYKGMDIGSGKITKSEMKGVPHHLLDIANPASKRYTVEDFKKDGERAINQILALKKTPIICGGTGFYIDALVFDTKFPKVPPNPVLRAKLVKKSVETLMKEITRLDPARAKNLDPFNKVRIIRAIEIAKALGKVPKISTSPKYNASFIGLKLDKEKLKQRIHIRLEKRMKAGMIKEIKKLHDKGVSWKRMYDFGLEYRYLSQYIQSKISKEQMLVKLETEIVKYAKRQMQWFKRNPKIQWFDAEKIKSINSFKILLSNF